MSITATELKNNLGKYLLLSATEDIFITKNGKVVAKLTNPYQDRVETAKSLFGILPQDADVEAARAENLGIKMQKKSFLWLLTIRLISILRQALQRIFIIW